MTSLPSSPEEVRMHLAHARSYAPEIKVTETVIRLRRMLESGDLATDGQDMTLTRIISALSHPALGGYSFTLGERLAARVLPLLGHDDASVRNGAIVGLIEYVGVLASTNEAERRAQACDTFRLALDGLSQNPTLGFAS